MDLFSTVSSETATDSYINYTDVYVNYTGVAETAEARRASGLRGFVLLFKVVYAIGIVGNAAAIVILRRGERRVRNRKHLLLMTSLAANDLVALVGMLCALVVSDLYPWVKVTRYYCAARVVLRVFGIGSVCIAVTMALERFLALTRPFLYQKQITYYVIRTALLVSWFWAAALTCAPILGLGLYYDEQKRSCMRYREALQPKDFGYAVVYVTFGTVLCVILVYCNLAVIRALYAISAPRPGPGGAGGAGAGGAPIVRRVSKTSCRQRSVSAGAPPHHNSATAEEVAFSRLMATLSVLFMICWLPQMITSTLYLSLGERAWKRLSTLAFLSDLLMLLNYVLDPIVYVLMRRSRYSLSNVCRSLAHCFKRRSLKTSTESMKSSACCQQDTCLASESQSSAAELRPLRDHLRSAAPVPTATIVKFE